MKKLILVLIIALSVMLVACNESSNSNKTPTEGLEYTLLSNDSYEVSGIGSASCGPALLKEYRLDEKEIKFSFAIEI